MMVTQRLVNKKQKTKRKYDNVRSHTQTFKHIIVCVCVCDCLCRGDGDGYDCGNYTYYYKIILLFAVQR